MNNDFGPILLMTQLNKVFINGTKERLDEIKKNPNEFDDVKASQEELQSGYDKLVNLIKNELKEAKKNYPEAIYKKIEETLTSLNGLTVDIVNNFDQDLIVNEKLDKFVNEYNDLEKYLLDNLEHLVEYSINVGDMTLDKYKESLSEENITPEYKTALQKVIDKKEKEMAEQAAMKEENGENPAEEQEEEEKSYADQMKDIMGSFENNDDYDIYMSAVIYKMLLAEGITPENTELINSALEFRRQKEQPEKDDTPEETIDLTEEEKDPVAEALAGLGVSEETIEAINNLDKNMPTVEYATGIQNLVVNDLVATINQSLSELDNKKNKDGKLSFMDNVRYSSLIQQKTQLKKGFNKTLKQKLDHIASIKQDEKVSNVSKDLLEAVEKNQKSTKRLERFKSAHQARKLNDRLTKLKEKRAIFNGEQLATNLVAYDKKNSRLKVASNIKAFGMESAKAVGNFIGATYRFVRKTPERFSNLKTKAGKLIKRSLTVDDEIINTAQELDNSEKSK